MKAEDTFLCLSWVDGQVVFSPTVGLSFVTNSVLSLKNRQAGVVLCILTGTPKVRQPISITTDENI